MSRGVALLDQFFLSSIEGASDRGERYEELRAYLLRLERVVGLADRMLAHEQAMRHALRTTYHPCKKCGYIFRVLQDEEYCTVCEYPEARPKTITTGAS